MRGISTIKFVQSCENVAQLLRDVLLASFCYFLTSALIKQAENHIFQKINPGDKFWYIKSRTEIMHQMIQAFDMIQILLGPFLNTLTHIQSF